MSDTTRETRLNELRALMTEYQVCEIQEIIDERLERARQIQENIQNIKKFTCTICKVEFFTNDPECVGICCTCQGDVVETFKLDETTGEYNKM